MFKKTLTMVFCMLCGFHFTYSQTIPFHYTNLVFEGAGMRGIAYVGVIEQLENAGLLKNIKNYAGTSAGAITALALAMGYNAYELKTLMESTSFQKFNDGRYLLLGGLNRLNSKYGWYRGKAFDDWLGKLILQKTGNANITLKELFNKTGKGLYVTGTCLNKQKIIVFSHETYPQMRARDAIRISMSIPLYYQAIAIDSAGKIYPKPKKTPGLDIMVDGGIIGNFPIFIFDQTQTDSAGHIHRIPNFNTLGIRVDSDEQIRMDRATKNGYSLANYPINNLRDYFEAFYLLTIESLNRQSLIAEDWQRTISVSSADIDPRVKKQSKNEKDSLMLAGRIAGKRFISNPLPFYQLLDNDFSSCVPNQSDPTYFIHATNTHYHQQSIQIQQSQFAMYGYASSQQMIQVYPYKNSFVHYQPSNPLTTLKFSIKGDTIITGGLIQLKYFIDSFNKSADDELIQYWVHSLDEEGMSPIVKFELMPMGAKFPGVYMLIMSDRKRNGNVIYVANVQSIDQFPLVIKFTPNCKGNEFKIKEWTEQ